MAPQVRKTPLDLLREVPFEKRYSAMIRADGTLFPVEERLGRRLLRTLPPDSREARELLRAGRVDLRSSAGTLYRRLPLETVYDRLCAETRDRLAERPRSSEWRSSCLSALAALRRRQRSLTRDH
jgi:hypothetical protein